MYMLDDIERGWTWESVEEGLKRVAYMFADACVSKAMARLKQHPDRSAFPYDELYTDFMQVRLLQEVEEYKESLDYRELTDIGNFAAWIWYGGAGNTPQSIDSQKCEYRREVRIQEAK